MCIQHVLHSYGLHLVSTYKYEVKKYFAGSIPYLLDINYNLFKSSKICIIELLFWMYNGLHYWIINYILNGVVRFLHASETNDPKVIIKLDEFSYFSKSMVGEPPIQIFDSNLCVYQNGNFHFTLMNILKDY